MSSKLYNDRKWRRARKAFLDANPICVKCKALGRIEVATVVDHIVPHKENLKLFWDEGNWQALCAHCHSSVKQLEELGRSAYDTACDINGLPIDPKHIWNEGTISKMANSKYILVYGSPASGKTTYVKENIKRGDIVIDFDLLTSALTMLQPHDCPESLLQFFWDVRDHIYRLAIAHEQTISKVWIIHCGATKAQRDKIESVFGTIEKIHIKASYNECLRRAKGDKTRSSSRVDQDVLIKRWFDEYEV